MGQHTWDRTHGNALCVSEQKRKTWIFLIWGWDKEEDWGEGREGPPSPTCCGGKMEYWGWAETLKVLFFPLIPSIRHPSLLLEWQKSPAQPWHRPSRMEAVTTVLFLLIYGQSSPPLLPKAAKGLVHMKHTDINQVSAIWNFINSLKLWRRNYLHQILQVLTANPPEYC